MTENELYALLGNPLSVDLFNTRCPDCGVLIDLVGDCGCDDDYARQRRAERAENLNGRRSR